MLDHEFKKVIANPRSVGCDVPGCGLREDLHPVTDIPRDVEDERRIKEYAASLVPMPTSYTAAYALSEQRALDGPIRNADTRDNPREVEEEIADAINYLVWEIQRLNRLEDTELIAEKRMEAYAAIVDGCKFWHSVQVYKHPND
jgi:hypothetical protein